MHALILAAGLGQRLGAHTRELTKAMVSVAGRTLIAQTLDALEQAGVLKATLVVGHGAKPLRELVGTQHGKVEIAYVENPLYASTNNIYSLWLARDTLLEDDTLLLESDIIFDPCVLEALMARPEQNLAAVAKFEPWMQGTVTLLDAEDHIRSFVPRELFEWSEAKHYWKTVNIYKLSRDFCERLYVPALEAHIQAYGRDRYYEQVLTAMTVEGMSELKAHRLTNEAWYEIDDAQDLDIAETMFASPEQRTLRFEQRFGGYWRFPQLKDFAYLVNPFFPPAELIEEMRASTETMLTSYPSGQRVQSMLAARAFGGEADQIVVGNGAAELLRVALPHLPSPIGVPVPTFEEYRKGTVRITVIELSGKEGCFARTADELVRAAAGLGTLVLVNPDNPSGHALAHHDVLGLVERIHATGVHLVVDESFADFASGAASGTLLDAAVLKRFPNLTVLKSISKSYGVPGVRLGVLATSNARLLGHLRSALPVWNVNSFAEVFMQIVPKYAEAFRTACTRLAQERERMFGALGAIPGLEALPSQGNFILVRIRDGGSARRIVSQLLEKHGLLIKDCSGKVGLEFGEFVRIAVRTPEDNNVLIAALRGIVCRPDA